MVERRRGGGAGVAVGGVVVVVFGGGATRTLCGGWIKVLSGGGFQFSVVLWRFLVCAVCARLCFSAACAGPVDGVSD